MFSLVVTKLRAPAVVDVKATGTDRLNSELEWGVSVKRYLLEKEERSPHGKRQAPRDVKENKKQRRVFFKQL